MRIVIKIGTSTITHPTGRLNIRQMEALCKVLSDLKNAGNEVILVSSGAIGMGVGKLRLGKKPVDVPTKQASAAVGQCELMYTYDKLFSEYRHTVAQILLTADDIADPARHENFQNTIQRLLELDAIPIINENDTVSVAEFGIGDNDTLSAIVATSVRRICWSCSRTSTGSIPPTRTKIRTRSASTSCRRSRTTSSAWPRARAPSSGPAG